MLDFTISLTNKENDDHMQRIVCSLADTFLDHDDDYAREKLMLSFCEPIANTERAMIANTKGLVGYSLRDEYIRAQEVVQSEIHRLHRHYLTIFSSVIIRSKKENVT